MFHSPHLYISPTCQASACLRAFVPPLPSAWMFPPTLPMTRSTSSFRFQLQALAGATPPPCLHRNCPLPKFLYHGATFSVSCDLGSFFVPSFVFFRLLQQNASPVRAGPGSVLIPSLCPGPRSVLVCCDHSTTGRNHFKTQCSRSRFEFHRLPFGDFPGTQGGAPGAPKQSSWRWLLSLLSLAASPQSQVLLHPSRCPDSPASLPALGLCGNR